MINLSQAVPLGGNTSDSRQEARLPTHLGGRIVLADLTNSHDVTIRDISFGGAKLRLGDADALPQDFYLLLKCANDHDYVRPCCEKRWQVGDMVGVRFTAQLTADDLRAVIEAGNI